MTYTSPWLDEEAVALKEMAAKFFETEAVPQRSAWEKQQYVDREFWLKAGSLGLLCAGIPEEYGGGGGTVAHDIAVFEAQSSTGETGFGNMVHSGLVAHYIDGYGTEEQKHRWLPGMASGELIGAIAMTEPGTGSDLKAIRTTGRRDGDQYVVNGSKTFISNGYNADLVIVVVKTDGADGIGPVTLVVVETKDTSGFGVGRVLEKAGQKSQDTAELFFEDVRVPVGNILGEEGRGWSYLMSQLAHERLLIADAGLAMMEAALADTVAYTKQREAFGKPLFELQNTRFELAECATIVHVARVFVDNCIVQHLAGELDPKTASMAKWWVTEMQCQVIDRCMQLFGGYGYMLEYPIARMFTDARIQKVYGGANEVMKELIARSL